MEFYTNVEVKAGKILYRGRDSNGNKIIRKFDYSPTLFLPCKEYTGYTTIHKENVLPKKFDNIWESRKFIQKHKDIEGYEFYGNTRYQYAFIADNFSGEISWDISFIDIAYIDIEVGFKPGGGFASVEEADGPITAITVKRKDKFTTFALGEYISDRNDVEYVQCANEIVLLKSFLDYWTKDYPDVVSGWNIQGYDLPYIIHRITKLLGEIQANRLSPWGELIRKDIDYGPGRTFITYSILGIASLDYLDIYQRFAPEGKSQESYKLDYIAHIELGQRKISYEEYGSLHRLMYENHQLFIAYNIKDTELIERLEDKLKIIELCLTLAYDSKSNYEDVFAQTRMWDTIIFNYFKEHKMVLPQNKRESKKERYIGAYVKEPITGMHDWVASFDLTSEYPSCILGHNISPETMITKDRLEKMLREENEKR